MIIASRWVKAAVLSGTAAAICSLLPPAATSVAAQPTVGPSAVAHVSVVPAPSGALAGGRHVLSGLRPGEYRAGFGDCGQPDHYARQWYGGALTAGAVRAVSVGHGHLTFLRPVAGKGPQLSGTVTNSAGKRLSGICVTVEEVVSGVRRGRGIRDSEPRRTVPTASPPDSSATAASGKSVSPRAAPIRAISRRSGGRTRRTRAGRRSCTSARTAISPTSTRAWARARRSAARSGRAASQVRYCPAPACRCPGRGRCRKACGQDRAGR